MVQLKKASNPIFHGNGLGTTTAGWTVKGSEHIAVRQLGTSWVAIDTTQDGAKLASAFDRQSLISKLEAILSADSIAEWLEEYPQIGTLCRDGKSVYYICDHYNYREIAPLFHLETVELDDDRHISDYAEA